MSRTRGFVATRTCVGCGGRDRQDVMLRLQLVGSRVEPVARPVVGRSAYVHMRRDCVGRVVAGRLLRRSLRVDLDKSARTSLVDRIARSVSDQALAGERANDSSRTI